MLNKKYDNIIERLDRIEKALERISPSSPSYHHIDNRERWCTKCGIKVSGVMGYVCVNADCPVGLNGPTCGGIKR